MNVFEYDAYKPFVLGRIQSSGEKGESRRLAAHLKIHPTRLSQVLRGAANFTPEQGYSLCRYFGFNEFSTDYFMTLLHLERAGTVELKRSLERQVAKLREGARRLVTRVPRKSSMSEQDLSVFYSSWYYSAISLLTAIPSPHNVDEIASRLDLPKDKVARAVEFLLRVGMCKEGKQGIEAGNIVTHIEASSPLASRHHANWRLKALQRQEKLSTEELAYTGPMLISRSDQELIRELLMEAISKATRIAVASPSERLVCLNVDWFEF